MQLESGLEGEGGARRGTTAKEKEKNASQREDKEWSGGEEGDLF